MSSLYGRVCGGIRKVFTWAITNLQKLHLEKSVTVLLTFDFILTLTIMLPTIMIHFVYVNPTGRSGFIGHKWLSHQDIYQFRRYQPWEQETPIDWNKGGRIRIYINYTRAILDERCSNYDQGARNPGDLGDYLKEVAGHPNGSGYNKRLVSMISMLSAAVEIMYVSEPLLVLSIWWKNERSKLVWFYIFLRSIPLVFLVCICFYAWSETSDHLELMCALDVIYGGFPVRVMLILFTVLFWIYQVFVFIILVLFCLEQNLIRKRRNYGFRKRKWMPKKSGETSDFNPVLEDDEEDDYDAEQAAHKEKKLLPRVKVEPPKKPDIIDTKALAREILELGDTTEDESVVEEQEKTGKRSTIEGNREGSLDTVTDDGEGAQTGPLPPEGNKKKLGKVTFG